MSSWYRRETVCSELVVEWLRKRKKKKKREDRGEEGV